MVKRNEAVIRKATMARVALALAPTAEDETFVVSADGERLRVGDRWTEASDDLGISVTIAARDGELHVTLTIRIDAADKHAWSAIEATPSIIACLPAPSVAIFAIELNGMHGRGVYAIGADPADAFEIREMALDPNARKTLKLIGVGRGRIRTIKVGVGLARIWTLLTSAFDRTPAAFPEEAFYAVLRKYMVSPQELFAAAMLVHLEPTLTP